jgi:hypothetical protein
MLLGGTVQLYIHMFSHFFCSLLLFFFVLLVFLSLLGLLNDSVLLARFPTCCLFFSCRLPLPPPPIPPPLYPAPPHRISTFQAFGLDALAKEPMTHLLDIVFKLKYWRDAELCVRQILLMSDGSNVAQNHYMLGKSLLEQGTPLFPSSPVATDAPFAT